LKRIDGAPGRIEEAVGGGYQKIAGDEMPPQDGRGTTERKKSGKFEGAAELSLGKRRSFASKRRVNLNR